MENFLIYPQNFHGRLLIGPLILGHGPPMLALSSGRLITWDCRSCNGHQVEREWRHTAKLREALTPLLQQLLVNTPHSFRVVCRCRSCSRWVSRRCYTRSGTRLNALGLRLSALLIKRPLSRPPRHRSGRRLENGALFDACDLQLSASHQQILVQCLCCMRAHLSEQLHELRSCPPKWPPTRPQTKPRFATLPCATLNAWRNPCRAMLSRYREALASVPFVALEALIYFLNAEMAPTSTTHEVSCWNIFLLLAFQ